MNADPLPSAEDLYDAAPCGHLLLAPSGQILQVNATFCRWLGHDAADLCGKASLHELFTSGGRIFFYTHLQPLLRMQGSVTEVKLEVRRKDGTLLPMLFNVVEREWKGKRLWHAAAFIAEDRHKYERELVLQRQRAEELTEQHAAGQQELLIARAQAEDRALFAEQLVGMVSHDIRNPLSVIHMSVALLERKVPPEQQKVVLGRMGRAVARVQHLIGDLLDFTQARLGSGLRVAPATIDLQQTVRDAVSELRVAFSGAPLEYAHSGATQVWADPDRIAQALGNLVANAATHGSPGRPITVRTEVGKETATISVHNYGAPIPPAVLPSLFEPMVRGSSGPAASKGVGLGLYIVREIARAHGGSVHARSRDPEGTTFVVTLPIVAPANDAPHAPP
ncbi:MAG TPA: PAS domain-containing sensor histidine kinase [Ramlibacter sp.]|nr:PAS domain-containing sensor histidine kinase [Ramlibacter sp.]